jgi:NADH-quinone oxidoreductase subunit M
MTNVHALSILIAIPFVGAITLAFTPRRAEQAAKVIAALFAGAAAIMSFWIWAHFDPGSADFQMIEKYDWISSFRIKFFLGIDGVSLPLVLLTTLMTLLAIIGSFHIEKRVKEYFLLFLLGESAMLGVFLSLDLFLFYVFWELTLVPMYFLIGMWGGEQRKLAAIKLFLYTTFGSVFMLVAMIATYQLAQPHTFDYGELLAQSATFSAKMQVMLFVGFAIAFAVKIPVVPFHTWLPLAHVEAPTAGSVILAGVLLKMGAYGLIRFCLGLFPEAAHKLAYPIAVFAAINILYGALCSLAQKDLKRMIAYSSINHMGYVLLGIASMSVLGFSGALLQMVNHGIITGMLFLLIGVIYDRTHSRDIAGFGGLAANVPVFAGFMIFASFASLGLPLLAGFVGEFLCFVAAFERPQYRLLTGISLLGLILTAAFFVRMIKQVFFGPLNEKWKNLRDINTREMVSIAPLAALTVVLGIYPGLILDPVTETLRHVFELLKHP